METSLLILGLVGCAFGVVRGAVRVAGKFGRAIECQQDALVEIPHAASFDDMAENWQSRSHTRFPSSIRT